MMTQEDKKLLLKDLCARFYYNPVVCAIGWEEPMRISNLDMNKLLTSALDPPKPYLRPMSNMTDEEKEIVNNLIYDKESIWASPVPIWVINESDIEEYVDFCNSHYLDYRGLIEKDLAVKVTEENNPYYNAEKHESQI